MSNEIKTEFIQMQAVTDEQRVGVVAWKRRADIKDDDLVQVITWKKKSELSTTDSVLVKQ
ncbi:MAG: hypothetical protein C0404_09265 [Verrucomicrobia bacterium]|nr:hypothetical protein [Verrucomicrobiota bacterium]